MKPRLSQIRPEGTAGQYPKVNPTSDGWVYDTPGAGGGAMSLIASTVLAAAAASITFSSIPATFNHLRLLVQARGSAALTFDPMGLRINGLSTAIYQREGVQISFDSVSSGRLSGQTRFDVGTIACGNAGANIAGVIVVDFIGYALTTFNKNILSSGGEVDAANTPQWRGAVQTALTTAAINSVSVFAETAGNNLIAGSAAWLYGIT